MRKPFYFWQKVAFIEETRVKLKTDGIVRLFRRKGTSFQEKTPDLLLPTDVLGAIRDNGVQFLVQQKLLKKFEIMKKNAVFGQSIHYVNKKLDTLTFFSKS